MNLGERGLFVSCLFLSLLFFTPIALAEEQQTRIFPIHRGFFHEGGAKDKELLPGIKPLSLTGLPFPVAAYDLREMFERYGVKFSEGSYAILMPGEEELRVRLPAEECKLVDSLMAGLDDRYLPRPRLRLSLVTFRLAEGIEPESFSDVDSLRRASGAFWQEISRLEGLTKSGQKVRLCGLVGETEPPHSSSSRLFQIPIGVSGAAVDAEIVVQPDGNTINVDLAYCFRSDKNTRREEGLFKYEGQTVLEQDVPKVISSERIRDFYQVLIAEVGFDNW